VAGYCDDGNDHAGVTKGGEFLEHLRDCWRLRKDSAAWS